MISLDLMRNPTLPPLKENSKVVFGYLMKTSNILHLIVSTNDAKLEVLLKHELLSIIKMTYTYKYLILISVREEMHK